MIEDKIIFWFCENENISVDRHTVLNDGSIDNDVIKDFIDYFFIENFSDLEIEKILYIENHFDIDHGLIGNLFVHVLNAIRKNKIQTVRKIKAPITALYIAEIIRGNVTF